MLLKFRKWWIFHIQNPSIRKGVIGGFKFNFKRYELIISTLSGNWKARWTAAEHPYGYLLSSNNDEQVHGFAYRMYMIGALLTTDQKFVDQIDRAIRDYDKRLSKQAGKAASDYDETDEKAAIEFERQVQEYIELPKKERRKRSREIDRNLKKTKEAVDNSE